MPLNGVDINKIPDDFSVAECKQLMDTENYTFDFDSQGKATTPDGIDKTP